MNSIESYGYERKCAARLLCLVILALVSCTLLGRPANAQDAGNAKASACVSPAMAQLLAREGNSIRVSAGNAPAATQAGEHDNEKGIAAAQAPESLRTLQRARDWFEKGARRGYAPAQVNLAVATLAGWGAPPNAASALYWLREAAHQGYALAYYDLGVLYMKGCGVRQDYAEAFRFFEQGANADNSAAQMNLGYLYDQGLGVAQDRVAAAVWYRKAAEAGVVQAQFNLADLYARGEGVSRSNSLAFAWFQVAAQQGDNRAKEMLRALAPHLNAAELAEAQALSRLLVSSAAPSAQVAMVQRGNHR